MLKPELKECKIIKIILKEILKNLDSKIIKKLIINFLQQYRTTQPDQDTTILILQKIKKDIASNKLKLNNNYFINKYIIEIKETLKQYNKTHRTAIEKIKQEAKKCNIKIKWKQYNTKTARANKYYNYLIDVLKDNYKIKNTTEIDLIKRETIQLFNKIHTTEQMEKLKNHIDKILKDSKTMKLKERGQYIKERTKEIKKLDY